MSKRSQARLPTRKNPRLLYSALAVALLVSMIASLMVSSAEMQKRDEPASEGSPITPAGSLLMDATTHQPAVGALPVDFVRSPDRTGPDGGGRYLIAVNSGYGVQFNAATNRAQQSLAVIDLKAKPAPVVIQNIYFPAPQSANVGAVFAPQAEGGAYTLYVSGGFENKIWMFRFSPGNATPVQPASPGPDTKVEAPFIDLGGFASSAPSPRYNSNHAPVYPTGLAISDDGNTLFVANNLDDSLGIISDLRGSRKLTRVDLRGSNPEQFIYPYAVVATSVPEMAKVANTSTPARNSGAMKAYVSCWNDASVVVVDTNHADKPAKRISVERHPTAMLMNAERTRLFVVNSNADSVSVIDTEKDDEIERISIHLAEPSHTGNSPESLALVGDTLYVANAHSNSVAVIKLSQGSAGATAGKERASTAREVETERSKLRGFIPTGQYPSAVAVAGRTLFVGNGKGTGFENSSVVVNNSGREPNIPNDRFPSGTGRAGGQGGEYSVALVAGNISAVQLPDEAILARYTQQVLRNNNLVGEARAKLFAGASPIKHIIYVIKENRTYDQVFGDLERAGNGQAADGDASLAIFGAGEAARRSGSTGAQEITPNHRALALRFGLFDRFFVNAEASPDGHNWSTAAFSTDYLDKAYRWNYGLRGRTYDFEGFNRLPNFYQMKDAPPMFDSSVVAVDIAGYVRRFIPYLNGSRDVTEPETLYLWDAAARAGLSYRNYGEFVGTLSENDVASIKTNRAKSYPDLSSTVSVLPTKKSLEGHHNASYRNFDLNTPDAMTVDSYRIAKESAGATSALISNERRDERFRGNSRIGSWLEEFRGFVADLKAGKPDRLPNLSIMRLSNDHTDGLKAGMPTPQFFVADNDFALGTLVEAVSNSPYWKDTAIFVVEDDAQDGPDHVDAHRSVALVISAYNRPGSLVHQFHNTVSLIRTMEILLGIEPMNQLDATAAPIDIFRTEADLSPYKARLPLIAIDNLMTPPARDAATAYWMRRTAEQDLSRADMADAATLNQIIWFSVKGPSAQMPAAARLPAFDLMRAGMREAEDEAQRPPARTSRRGGLNEARTSRRRADVDEEETGNR